MDNITLESVMANLDRGDSLSTKDMLAFRAQKDSISNIITALDTGTLNQRINAVGFVSDMGRVMIAADSVLPERPGPIIVEPEVISYLVDMLNNVEKDIRNPACIALAALVPAELFQQHHQAIITAIEKYPHTDGAVVLLGKTNSPKAMELLKKPEISGASAEDAQMAMARLGDELAEQSIISSYLKSDTAKQKAQYARRLGYIASNKTIKLLAEEIRTPDYYEWHPPAKRSLRLHIIEGLHLAFMQQPIFWKPLFPPSDDRYYQNIEDWLTKNVGVTWQVDRPKFLYQIQAPVMPPGR